MSADLNVGALSEEDGVLVHLAEANGEPLLVSAELNVGCLSDED